MLLTFSHVPSALVLVALLGHVSASPVDAAHRLGSVGAECSYEEERPSAPEGLPMLAFTVRLRGFGSRAGLPGHILLEEVREAGLAPFRAEQWAVRGEWVSGGEVRLLPLPGRPDVESRGGWGTGSEATFRIPGTATAVGGVENAISLASRGKVKGSCVRRIDREASAELR
ncbi:MAG: hypothetical protein M1832_004878 [Thelocarpon impressellum]|nr:MAG: hypothetical protein M1832_004878 [Thelocarpon impressellum]